MPQVLLGLGRDGPLAPGTQYFYVVGDSADVQSEALSFTTPPLIGPESLPYRRVYGDASGVGWRTRARPVLALWSNGAETWDWEFRAFHH